jgi:outer membrane protein TolC
LATLDQILQDAVQHRPELLEAKAIIHQQESARTLATKQYYPDVRVEFQRWLNLDQRDGFGGNVTMNIPFAFWTKPKYDAGVRETLAAEQAARTRHRSLRNITVFQVKDFWVKLQASQRVADLFSTTVLPQAEQNLTASLAGYRTGNVGFLDVIDAARSLEDFRLSYYRALVEREQHLAALEQVIGREIS